MKTPISVRETSEARNWSEKRVRSLIHTGLPTVQIGRQHLIFPDTLDQYLRRNEKTSPRVGPMTEESRHEATDVREQKQGLRGPRT